MRVTQGMLTANLLRNLNNSNARLSKLQEQLYTQRKISRPSDDPVVALKGMAYRTNLTEVEQYRRNLTEMYNWMDNSEAGLEQANAIFQRTRELVVKASNLGTHDQDDLEKIKAEISQLKEALYDVANTQVAGKYIYNGTNVTTPPAKKEGDEIIFTSEGGQPFKIEVSKGVSIEASINAANVFGDAFKTFEQLEQKLIGADVEEIEDLEINSFITSFQGHIDSMLAEQAELGARYNRVELVEDRLSNQEVIAHTILKENEGADMERVITELKMQETIHRAALSVGARVIQPSLVDFLR